MGTDDFEHMRTIDRWLAGEVVNNAVGIKVVGGPFDGRIKIVLLGQDGTPPALIRASGGPAGPTRHAYEAIPLHRRPGRLDLHLHRTRAGDRELSTSCSAPPSTATAPRSGPPGCGTSPHDLVQALHRRAVRSQRH
ncbi:hypothetical protein [Kitasatospora purpeofusca]|uniref:hypothetical protein n=1 Tax=Kitasatospora purpeofusca TaxID=67352 RepID=UPI003F4A9AD0